MRRYVKLGPVVLAAFMGVCGCKTTHMNIPTTRPAVLTLHPNRTLVLLRGSGSQRGLQVAAAELQRQSAGGHFQVEDARGSRLRIVARGNRGPQVIPRQNRDAAYLQVNIVKWLTVPGVAKEGREVTLPNGNTVTRPHVRPVLRGSVRLQVTMISGPHVYAREYAGGSQADIAIPPPPVAEKALAQAIASLLADITPRVVWASVKLDRKSEATMPFVNLARAGNIQGAAEGLRQYLQAYPNDSNGHYNLAVMLDALGEYDSALTHYDQSIVLGGKGWYRKGRASCAERLAERQALSGR
jgi:hypothetical protein